MISVFILIIFLMFFLLAMRASRAIWIRYAVMIVFTVLIVEGITLGYFFVQIQKGTCFFLIGHDKVLDSLIKLRLSYATYFSQGQKTFINKVDDDLGYSLGKDKDTGMYQTNNQGFRANREYSLFADDKHLRIVTLGDSFVFCDGERNEDAWPFILEKMSDRLEVLNFGVPGYGLGQSYLRYLKYARQYHPDIVFINYVTVGNRDKIDRQELVSLNNLRIANFYRVHFWVENGILMTRAMSPYDLFEEGFRKKFLFDEEQILHNAHWGFLKQLSFFNVGLLVKGMALQHLVLKSLLVNSDADDNLLEFKVLSDFLQTAQKDGSQVIFFYDGNFDKLPKNIQDLFQSNKSFVTYVNSRKAIQEQVALHNAQNHNLRNSSNHYNPEGNLYYAKAVFKVLRMHPWSRGKQSFQLNDREGSN